ncbi:MAG: metalloregulator ArsR/SmtB family transcription factor [Betaproteobacteria bacterium]
METTRAMEALAALAQETRLRIFRLLVEHGPAGTPAGDIGRALDLPPATLSFHVKALATAGLVAARPQGRYIHYSTNFAAIRELVAYLTENCCRADAGSDDCSAACAPDCAPLAGPERTLFAIPKPNVRPKRRVA